MVLNFFIAALLLVHALIHFRGFAMSINYGDDLQQGKSISTTLGVFWFLTSLLLVTSAILFIIKSAGWPVTLLIAITLSQILITSQWQDARAGTIVNILLVCIAIPAFGNMRFQQRVNKEVTTLWTRQYEWKKTDTSRQAIAEIPLIVQRWLERSGIQHMRHVNFAHLKQKGEMRLKPGGKWMPFEAEEYFRIDEPAFVWNSSVKMFPMVYLNGRDKFQSGDGEMLIKALSLVTVVNEKPGERINEGSLLRFLGEICWVPAAALSKNIKWEAIDSFTAKAIMNYKNTIVSGIFQFNEMGDIIGFLADRYYNGSMGYSKEKWQVKMKAYKNFNGIRIPSECEVIWKLPDGDFNWINVEIIDVRYNQPDNISKSHENK